MNFKRLLHSKFGQIIISILLGLGLATLFRKFVKIANVCYLRVQNLIK